MEGTAQIGKLRHICHIALQGLDGRAGIMNDFGRFFKKHTGRTPSEFRSAARRALAPSPAQTLSPGASPAHAPTARPRLRRVR